jgi:hypothetical protein
MFMFSHVECHSSSFFLFFLLFFPLFSCCCISFCNYYSPSILSLLLPAVGRCTDVHCNGSFLLAISALICRYFSPRMIRCKEIVGTYVTSVLDALIVPCCLFIIG